MATLFGGAIQTTFAAVSFAGAGYLFKSFDNNGYLDEVRRHNKALEDLAKSKEVYYENEVKRRDKIQRLRQQLSDANQDINTTNAALDNLRKVLARTSAIQRSRKDRGEPTIGDFYRPSDKMKEYQLMFAGAVGIPLGYLAYIIL